jgi:tetratricopeptide (TPR) repeat protein
MKSSKSAKRATVEVRTEDLILPTYLPAMPDRNPMFLEKRVYQGSSGKVYPLPFTDRISEKPVDHKWKAVWLENEFIRLLVLPELGGRIHRAIDKTNNYDFIYYQPVIKPALVGLAGPWISGGIEFNWPQHHRPATFLPADFEIEKHADGSATVWCGDHDPMSRMKGMHGIHLHPERAYIELKVRAYNRTPFVQTFLWWANVATRVHEGYQSFFPPDVYYVADHARRSMSEYPFCEGHYYGVNYGKRGRRGVPSAEMPTQFIPPHHGSHDNSRTAPLYKPNDLSFYSNIPVPTSYMCMGSKEDFFGGYDHKAQAGIVHVANHHISPGKKQWTWGNHEFGYSWDRNLAEPDSRGEYAPYIELMAGVYTDNQPDFSFLQPGETKTWSQFWYPIQQIGPAQQANLHAAVNLKFEGSKLHLGVAATRKFPGATIKLVYGKKTHKWNSDLSPGKPFFAAISARKSTTSSGNITLRVFDCENREIISFEPKNREHAKVPPPATEPATPSEIASADELFITGLHLEQYRHATRCPTAYWLEALRRDPLDSRCNNAMGLWHLRRGEFQFAEKCFRRAIERLTLRNANPYDGEAYYNLGLCLRYQNRDDEAYDAFYKACWNQAWMSAGYHALAEIDCCREHWNAAMGHLNRSLRLNADNNRARNLSVLVMQKLKAKRLAAFRLAHARRKDPLDWWARFLSGEKVGCDVQATLDIAHDYARAGFFSEAIDLLASKESTDITNDALPNQSWGALPTVHYTLGWLHAKCGDSKAALKCYRRAQTASPDYCFPSRLEEIAILESAIRSNPEDSRAPYYLGNLFYDRRRHEEAIQLWEHSARMDATFSLVWRNLGIGYFNIRKQPARAKHAYDRALRANPQDARVLFERDQLWKRLGAKPTTRLHELEKRMALVSLRDDLNVELCALYNQTGQHLKAMQLLNARHFQPWEGGEGGPLGQHVRTQIAFGRDALRHQDYYGALAHFESALTSPLNLGEAKHLLANQSDIHYWAGSACNLLGEKRKARSHWRAAATSQGDFQEMSARAFSEMTYYSALSWKQLGYPAKANALLKELLAHARKLEKTAAKIDYFATSLPAMLLFEDDLQFRQATTAMFLQAQAHLGLGHRAEATKLLTLVLERDPNHSLASDLKTELSNS